MTTPPPRFSRRRVLASLGAAATGLLAGCIGSPGIGHEDREYEVEVLDDPGSYESSPVPEPPDVEPGPATFVVTVGRREDVDDPDGTKPREVGIWNDADRERTCSLSIRESGTELFARDVALPADRTAVVALREPGQFRIDVAMGGGETTVEKAPDDFDCNDAATVVRIGPDGETGQSSVRTDMACT